MYTNVRTIGTFETIVLDFIDRNEGKSVNCHRGLMLHGYDKNTIIPIKSFIHTNATNKYLALVLPLSNWPEDLYWSTDFFLHFYLG